ncbi:OLC1v1000495C1 [Oldenlandia corymbosa var. corymbosa]|uniref:OLC1v1000495C1 n=1 Tax=Oldenlandia corymbosa var. corymbosa TaxID=529605 RepID=A0AAV1D2Y9_OLDCO|nr:OLC1v1000495C1 [Oldenlandia corymbosa var. corymbosa]
MGNSSIFRSFLRSQDWRGSRFSDMENRRNSTNRLPYATRRIPSMSDTFSFRRGFRIKRFMGPSTLNNESGSVLGRIKEEVIDPQRRFYQLWNKIFAVSFVIALFLDPLFSYIHVIDNNRKCIDLDKKLMIVICVLRSFVDLVYMFHIFWKFHIGYTIAASSSKLYLVASFMLDILSALPVPQVVIFIIAPRLNVPTSLITRNQLMNAMIAQFDIKFFKICLMYMEMREVTRASRISAATSLIGAALCVFLCMLATNLFGAWWYILSIKRVNECWRASCAKHHCNPNALNCGVPRVGDYSFLNSSCPLLEPNEIKRPTDFDFGIFLEALQSRVVEKENFWQKFVYCYWWGLRSLSSLGQNLKTSTYYLENFVAIDILTFGLVLFGLLIFHIQTSVQSLGARMKERRAKKRDKKKIDQWMSELPENLRHRIRRYEKFERLDAGRVQEVALVKNLPKDLKRDINRHHCWDLLAKVPMFSQMDDQLKDVVCERLKPVFYSANDFIYCEGDQIDELLLLTHGNLLSMTNHGKRNGFAAELELGDLCGEELIPWALDPASSSSLPISTRTIKAMKNVEAFALRADDLRFVTSQFRQLHREQIQHIFRFYSHEWRRWAASLIQAAWCNHCRKELEKSLRRREESLQVGMEGGGPNSTSSASAAATICASKFSATALRAQLQTPPLLHQKPPEPDYNADSSNVTV